MRLQNNVLVIPTTSILDDRYPEISSSVRADLKLGGWILFPTPEGNTKAVFMSCCEMKGSLPTMFVQQGATMQSMLPKKLCDYMVRVNGQKQYGQDLVTVPPLYTPPVESTARLIPLDLPPAQESSKKKEPEERKEEKVSSAFAEEDVV